SPPPHHPGPGPARPGDRVPGVSRPAGWAALPRRRARQRPLPLARPPGDLERRGSAALAARSEGELHRPARPSSPFPDAADPLPRPRRSRPGAGESMSPTVSKLRPTPLDGEEARLEESRTRTRHWKRWGPYLSERAWGTVREDYSPGGTAWDDLPHDHARSRAYRWNEDGIAGISDRHQILCFALALWNEQDPILKERLFGLTGQEGNHGEDCKELYWYLDSTPTHSFMRMLYKYPHRAYPYEELVRRNREAGRGNREVELLDTGALEGNRYVDVQVDYAKADAEDILIRIEVANRGPELAPLHLLPTLWFRNVWSWGRGGTKPALEALRDDAGRVVGVRADHPVE